MRKQSSTWLKDGLFDKKTNEGPTKNLEGNYFHEKEDQNKVFDEIEGIQSPKKRSTLRGATKKIVNVNKLSNYVGSKSRNLPKTPGELSNSS